MDITKNFPVFTQSKHMILRKDQIYAICVYDTKEYENIVYNSVNDVFYIKNNNGDHVIEEIKNDEHALENIRKTILNNTLSNGIYIDKLQDNKVMEFPCVKIYTTKESTLPGLVVYRPTLEAAIEKYMTLTDELKDSSQFINLS